jgi:hypothetical protein
VWFFQKPGEHVAGSGGGGGGGGGTHAIDISDAKMTATISKQIFLDIFFSLNSPKAITCHQHYILCQFISIDL